MNHHALRLRNPEGAARIIAEMLDGEALPLPPLSNVWVVLTSRGEGLELYPDVLNRQDAASVSPFDGPSLETEAVSTSPLTPNEINSLARKAGWPSRHVRRSSGDYVEVAIEGRCRIAVMCTGDAVADPAKRWFETELPRAGRH